MSQVTFQYKAIDSTGARTRGSVTASNQDEAFRRLTSTGMKPIWLRTARRRRRRSRRIGARELSHLTHQMSVLMAARIPIAEGLRTIAEQETNDRLADVLRHVAGSIEAGNTVTESLQPHRRLFGSVFIETLRSAELSGTLIAILEKLAIMLEQRYEMGKAVKNALLYPICVIISIVLATTGLLIFVVPRFTAMYARRNLDLPFVTKLLIGSSEFVRGYWWLIIMLVVGGWFLFKKGLRNPKFERRVDRFIHRIPVCRDMLKGLATFRFAQVLGISLQSGLGLIDALDMAGKASGRPLLRIDSEKMQAQVNNGGRLTDVMMACTYLPPFARKMLSAGENAGELPRMCVVVSRHFERESRYLTKSLTTMIEPFLIAGLAGVVLIVALGIFLPMWNMAALI